MGRKKLSEDIYEDMERKIITGVYRMGEKIPSERTLAAYYAVSRIPVREAMEKLVRQGFLRVVPGSGSTVISQGEVFDAAEPAMFASQSGQQHTRLLLETVRLRCLLETEAARLAAINRTTDDIKKIQESLFASINEIRKLKMKETNAFFEADRAFHRAIVEASKSPFLTECCGAIPNLITSHQYWSLKHTNPRDEVVTYHTRIYESILDGDEAKAAASMKEHLSRVEMLMSSQDKRGG